MEGYLNRQGRIFLADMLAIEIYTNSRYIGDFRVFSCALGWPRTELNWTKEYTASFIFED